MTNRVGPALLLVAILAACAPKAPSQEVGLVQASAGLCRVGTDGAMPMADRGIGGTGAPVRLADRGIGGTGAPSGGGIGGTGGRAGIVGVITGFASVCLAGEEVGYAPGLPILVDGQVARLDALRAGQVAVVVAEGAAAPIASSLSIRHEVSGPIESMQPDGTLIVAGQSVLLPPRLALDRLERGRWVVISGFRQATGVIGATRLDAREPGEVLVRGTMRLMQGRLFIGLTEIRPGRFQERRSGLPVVAIGRLNAGVLDADTVEVDALLVDPTSFFGPAVNVLVLEGYVEGGTFSFGRHLRAAAEFGDGRALARFQRGAQGEFLPGVVQARIGFGALGGAGPRIDPEQPGRFERAPTPNRGLYREGRGEGGWAGNSRNGDMQDGQGRRASDGASYNGQERQRRDGEFGQGGKNEGGFGSLGGFRGPGR